MKITAPKTESSSALELLFNVKIVQAKLNDASAI